MAVSISEAQFDEKIMLITDSYYDREYFTNLIFCIDRGKTTREIWDRAYQQYVLTPRISIEFDQALLHLVSSFQASSLLRENYRWLPLAQGLYAASLFRADGQVPVGAQVWTSTSPEATNLKEFSEEIFGRRRQVESEDRIWAHFLFLLQSRTSRAAAVEAVLKAALKSSDALTIAQLVKAAEMTVSDQWRRPELYFHRAFRRFWLSQNPWSGFKPGHLLVSSRPMEWKTAQAWEDDWGEELWKRVSEQTLESGWEWMQRLASRGASYETLMNLLILLRGRLLFGMRSEEWSTVAESLVISSMLEGCSKWIRDGRDEVLASNLWDLHRVAQQLSVNLGDRPTGQSLAERLPPEVSKDRLTLRLDDSLERGDRAGSLDLTAVLVKDEGLSHSLSDRLLLAAAKQDAWTYDQKVLPVALILNRAFEAARRVQIGGLLLNDALFGLVRWLSDLRDESLAVVKKTGTYGDDLKMSRLDGSAGARIIDRFVFNQMRNAQRVKIWPSDD